MKSSVPLPFPACSEAIHLIPRRLYAFVDVRPLIFAASSGTAQHIAGCEADLPLELKARCQKIVIPLQHISCIETRTCYS
jgi:hypothetical protein